MQSLSNQLHGTLDAFLHCPQHGYQDVMSAAIPLPHYLKTPIVKVGEWPCAIEVRIYGVRAIT